MPSRLHGSKAAFLALILVAACDRKPADPPAARASASVSEAPRVANVEAAAFTYAGVSLGSDIRTVAARYPHSTPQGDYIRLDPADVHDHISAIEMSGTGPGRRVRIAFETEGASGRPDYPRCRDIEVGLVAKFGRPGDIRRFSEEVSPRADRVWRAAMEELALICFRDGGAWWAEAVQIARR